MFYAHRKRGQAGATRAQRQAPTDLARFEPNTPLARNQVDELVRRGAIIVAVRPALVTLKRAGQTACADSWGRVEWAH